MADVIFITQEDIDKVAQRMAYAYPEHTPAELGEAARVWLVNVVKHVLEEPEWMAGINNIRSPFGVDWDNALKRAERKAVKA